MSRASAVTAWSRPMATAAAMASTVVALQWLGRGSLAAPPLTSWSALLGWAEQRDPITIAMVTVRLSTLLLGYHLLATSALVLVGRVLRLPGLISWAEAVTLPPFRGTVQRLIGLSLSASTLLAGPVTSAGAAAPRVAIERVVFERVDSVLEARHGDGTATLHLESTPEQVSPTPPALPAPVTHRVVPGDHLWSISEASLASAIGRAPTDAEIDPYWRRVVASNPQLADPDLIYPGDLINVPPPI